MTDGWAGRTRRDEAIRDWAAARLLRTQAPPDSPAVVPPLLLLGPRGTGKTSLLAHVAQWTRHFPLASVDVEGIAGRGGTRIDILSQLAFQLSARKKDVPPLAFPSFTVLLMAVAAAVDQRSRRQAVQQMRDALRQDRSQDHSFDTLQTLLEGLSAAAGLPGWIGAVTPLLSGWRRLFAAVRLRMLLRRVPQDARAAQPADFLVGVNLLYNGLPAQREEAEQTLTAAFLADLRAAYAGRGGRQRTTNCLALLDNVDCPLGESFLRLLLDSRPRTGPADPLLVVLSARTRPEALTREEAGLRGPVDDRASWPDDEEFQPVRAGRLQIARLRDLNRREVEERAAEVLGSLPYDARRPHADNPVQWLGWIVHQLTRGHPAATAELLDVLGRFPADTEWADRLRLCLADRDRRGRATAATAGPSAGPAVLALLVRDFSQGLRVFLPRTAAAVTLGQAEMARELWDRAGGLRMEFADFAADDLRTLSLAGDQRVTHPLLRYLLLRRLDAAGDDAGPGSWTGAHHVLRRHAVARGEDRTAAYHDLACGDLPAAVEYLRDRFDRVGAEEWCDDLAWIQKAPSRWPSGLPERAHARYEHLVGVAQGDAQRRAITRLLAAGWITVHPHTVPYGELYADPLGDPYAELYSDIVEEFLTLRDLVGNEHDRYVFLRKAEQYRRKPWW